MRSIYADIWSWMCSDTYTGSFAALSMSLRRGCLHFVYAMAEYEIPCDKEEAKESFCFRWTKVAPSPIYILALRESSCALFHWLVAELIMEALLVDRTYSHRYQTSISPLRHSDARENTASLNTAHTELKLGISPWMDMSNGPTCLRKSVLVRWDDGC